MQGAGRGTEVKESESKGLGLCHTFAGDPGDTGWWGLLTSQGLPMPTLEEEKMLARERRLLPSKNAVLLEFYSTHLPLLLSICSHVLGFSFSSPSSHPAKTINP